MTHSAPQKPLIFDSARIPWPKRYFQRLINATGWSLWLLLWLPVTSSAQKLLSTGGQLDSELIGLINATSFGALAVLIMSVVFAGWSQNQRRGDLAPQRRLRRAHCFLKTELLAKVFAIDHRSLCKWQDSQVMLAHHSDDTGWLQTIDELPFILHRSFDASPPTIILKAA